jgi:hypothetical protein
MLACRIPTLDGPAQTNEVRLKTSNALAAAMPTCQTSRHTDTLASVVGWSSQTGGYHYLALINGNEAAKVFAAMRDLREITMHSNYWVNGRIAVFKDDVGQLDDFIWLCRG